MAWVQQQRQQQHGQGGRRGGGHLDEFVQFQCTQDRCALIDGFNVGDKIEVTFNLRGREWSNPQGEKKYFNTLEAWRVQKVESAANAPAAGGSSQPMSYSMADLSSDDSDDLPF